jgi:hypothetical protein
MRIKAPLVAREDNPTMPGITLSPDMHPDSPPLRRIAIPPVAPVFLPKEHGSWSLVLEPLALGLLVAPSWSGTALATAALAGFFARRPLMATIRPVSADRRRTAGKTLAALSTLAVIGLLEAGLSGRPAALWPLLCTALGGGLFVYFDACRDARAMAAELAGSAAFAFLPAALATLAGWPPATAFALAAVALARGVPTVLTVRTSLRLGKGQAGGAFAAMLAAGLAAAGLIILAQKQLVPWLAAGFATLFLLRTAWLVTPLRPVWPARRIGLIESILGALYVGAIALAYHHP